MCYYNGIRVSRTDFLRLLNIEKSIQASDLNMPMQSGFDFPSVPIIQATKDKCDWEWTKMEWGFLTYYLKNREAVEKFRNGYKDENGKWHTGYHGLNFKGEELLFPNKMFRESGLKRRCLMPVTHFFEWRHLQQMGKKGLPLKATRKVPYFINVKDTEVFYIAAVYSRWVDKDTGETVNTFSSGTTKANSIMEQVHNSQKRMPTILTEELAGEWISEGLSEERITEIATYQISAEEMKVHTLPKNFKEALDPTEKYEYKDIPELVY